MKVEPYLFFNGRCEEAIEFYKRALGAKVTMLMRYKDAPQPAQPGMIPPNSENKIMHASLRIGETTNSGNAAGDGGRWSRALGLRMRSCAGYGESA